MSDLFAQFDYTTQPSALGRPSPEPVTAKAERGPASVIGQRARASQLANGTCSDVEQVAADSDHVALRDRLACEKQGHDNAADIGDTILGHGVLRVAGLDREALLGASRSAFSRTSPLAREGGAADTQPAPLPTLVWTSRGPDTLEASALRHLVTQTIRNAPSWVANWTPDGAVSLVAPEARILVTLRSVRLQPRTGTEASAEAKSFARQLLAAVERHIRAQTEPEPAPVRELAPRPAPSLLEALVRAAPERDWILRERFGGIEVRADTVGFRIIRGHVGPACHLDWQSEQKPPKPPADIVAARDAAAAYLARTQQEAA